MRFSVTKAKEEALRARMERLGVKESDIEETFIRSSKPGGQHVNKTSTCVVLRYHPLSVEIKCQAQRSQILNRFIARKMLTDKIEQIILGRASRESKRVAKIRRQKRRRSRRAKEKMLRLKKMRSKIKGLRRKPTEEL